MAQISDLSDLINRQTGGNNGTPEIFWWQKNGRTGGSSLSALVGLLTSCWDMDGIPGRGSKPTVTTVCDSSTSGAIRMTAAGSGRQKWLVSTGRIGNNKGFAILYDRLVHKTGLDATLTTAQTIQGNPASPAITRHTDGIGTMILVEIYTLIGNTGTTITANYLDQDGNSATTGTVTFGGSGPPNCRDVTRAFLLPLAAGDIGVKSITSVTLAGSTGLAGNFGVSLIYPIAMFGSGSYSGNYNDYVTGLPNMPEFTGNECLAILETSGDNRARQTFGYISTVEK